MDGDELTVGEARPIFVRVTVQMATALLVMGGAAWFCDHIGLDAVTVILICCMIGAPLAWWDEVRNAMDQVARRKNERARQRRDQAERTEGVWVGGSRGLDARC